MPSLMTLIDLQGHFYDSVWK